MRKNDIVRRIQDIQAAANEYCAQHGADHPVTKSDAYDQLQNELTQFCKFLNSSAVKLDRS